MGLHEGPHKVAPPLLPRREGSYYGFALSRSLQRAAAEPVSNRLQRIVWLAVIVAAIGAFAIAVVVTL